MPSPATLKALREQADVSQAQAAAKARLSPALISYLESGDRPVTRDVAKSLAAVYKCLPHDVFAAGKRTEAMTLLEVVRKWDDAELRRLAGEPDSARQLVIAAKAINAAGQGGDAALKQDGLAFARRVLAAIEAVPSATKATARDFGNRDALGRAARTSDVDRDDWGRSRRRKSD